MVSNPFASLGVASSSSDSEDDQDRSDGVAESSLATASATPGAIGKHKPVEDCNDRMLQSHLQTDAEPEPAAEEKEAPPLQADVAAYSAPEGQAISLVSCVAAASDKKRAKNARKKQRRKAAKAAKRAGRGM